MWAWGLHTGNVNHMTKDCVLMSSSLFSHKTMCNFFLQMYKKNHKPLEPYIVLLEENTNQTFQKAEQQM